MLWEQYELVTNVFLSAYLSLSVCMCWHYPYTLVPTHLLGIECLYECNTECTEEDARPALISLTEDLLLVFHQRTY